jgi:hypothetical protein
VTLQGVDVGFGEENITNLTFDPASAAIASPIPLRVGSLMVDSALVAIIFSARRRYGNQTHFAHFAGAGERPGRRFVLEPESGSVVFTCRYTAFAGIFSRFPERRIRWGCIRVNDVAAGARYQTLRRRIRIFCNIFCMLCGIPAEYYKRKAEYIR